MEEDKLLIDGMIVPFDCLIAIGVGGSPLEDYRRFCENNNVIDNKRKGFKGVQIIDSSKVLTSTGPAGTLEEKEIKERVWTHAFVGRDSVVLVPYLAFNINSPSITIKKNAAVRLMFWEKQVDKREEGRHSPVSGLANLHELDRRGK